MAAGPTPVGVILTAEQEQAFVEALNRATQAVNNLTTAIKSDTEASVENDTAIKANADAVETATTSHSGFYSQLRAGRIAVAAITAEMALMTIVAGQQLPDGLRETAKGLQLIVDLGTTGFLLGGGPGAAIGALAGVVLSLGAAASTQSQSIQDLDTKLTQLSKQDELQTTLSNITSLTKDQTAVLLDAASKDPAFAKQLLDMTKAAEPLPILINAFVSSGDALGSHSVDWTTALNQLNFVFEAFIGGLVYIVDIFNETNTLLRSGTIPTFQDFTKVIDDATAAETKFYQEFDKNKNAHTSDPSGLLAEAAAIEAQQTEVALLKQATAAQETYAKAVDASYDSLNKLTIKTGEAYAQAQQQYNDAISKAGGSLDDARTKAQVAQDDADVKLRQQYNERIAAIDQQLADRRTDIATQLADRLFDIQTRLGDALASAEETLQTRLAAIDSQQKDSLISLDKSTAEQIRTAQTQHDIEEIKRKAEIQKEAINLRTGDEKTAAQNEYEQRVQQAEQAAREEIAIANRTAAEQRAISLRTANEQRATAIQTAKDGEKAAADAAQAAYEAARRAYDLQVQAARKAQQDRDEAIAKSYAAERQQIETTYQDALDKLEKLILKVNEFNLAAVYALSLQGFIQQLGLTPSTSSPISSFSPNVLGNLFGGAVPHGLSAGGSVSNVFSPSTTANGQTYNFYINGAFAPQDIVKEIDKYLLDHQH